jgi:hypothetical protein
MTFRPATELNDSVRKGEKGPPKSVAGIPEPNAGVAVPKLQRLQKGGELGYATRTVRVPIMEPGVSLTDVPSGVLRIHFELGHRSIIAESYVEFTIPHYFNVEWANHFLCRVPSMLLQRSVFPLLSISALEVSDVHPNRQSSSVRVERRMVLR